MNLLQDPEVIDGASDRAPITTKHGSGLRTFRVTVRRTITAAVLMLATAVPLMGTAHATHNDTGYGSASARVTGGYASAKWEWTGAGTMSGINLRVDDNGCDNRSVYARLRITFTNGTYNYTPKRYDNKGCEGAFTDYNNLAYTSNFTIHHANVQVCVDESWPRNDHCVNGADSPPNPHR